MIFAAPLWLIGLAPLAAVVVYLLWGRRRQEAVPFLELWRGPVKGPRPKRRFAAPPVALALAILAMLLAILGAARPGVWDATRGGPVTIVVDRGATMSAADRFATLAREVNGALGVLGAGTPVELIVVPGVEGGGVEQTTVGGWMEEVSAVPPTAVDTTAAVRAEVARRRVETGGPIIVISDKLVEMEDARVARVAPGREVRNAGIVLLAARESPRGQVMVRVRNRGVGVRAELRVSSGGREVTRTIELPAGEGDAADHFVDVESLGEVVKAEIRVEDEFAGDDAAWLVRRGGWPRVEGRGELPAEVRRMVEVYTSARPAGVDAVRVVVAGEREGVPEGTSGVVVAEGKETVAGEVVVRPHEVTRGVKWELGDTVRVAEPPGGEWTEVVSVGGRTAVAVREVRGEVRGEEGPVRRVWVGVESEGWVRTAGHVVLWGNVLDWVGGGEVRFLSDPAGRLGGQWAGVDGVWKGTADGGGEGAGVAREAGLWPGLYRRADDGALRAVNAGEVRFAAPPGGEWKRPLMQVLSGYRRGAARAVSGEVLVAAATCAALAAALWRRGGGTPAVGRGDPEAPRRP